MNLFEQLGISIDYIIIGMAGVIVLMLLFIIILFIRTSQQKKKYQLFMGDTNAKTLEESILQKMHYMVQAEKEMNKISERVKVMEEGIEKCYCKSAILKYDAFKEMGGKLSFTLALLNNEDSGIIINSMHSTREGCFTYIKEVINGKSFVMLSDEEKQVLKEAINTTNYME